MKPVDFAYERPSTIARAVEMLASSGNAKVMAGGQTLGPMLNLRLAQPELIVDITRIPELKRVEETADRLVLGACVTHASIEDGRVPDPAKGMLTRVASRIAYRAVRTRGTVGGSLANADPAADWLSSLTALGGTVAVVGPKGRREIALAGFVRGFMETELAPDEIVESVSIPKLPAGARWGYHKICRKTGELADAIGAAVIDGGIARLVAGATSGKPVVLDVPDTEAGRLAGSTGALAERLCAAGLDADAYETKIHTVAVRRALTEALQA